MSEKIQYEFIRYMLNDLPLSNAARNSLRNEFYTVLNSARDENPALYTYRIHQIFQFFVKHISDGDITEYDFSCICETLSVYLYNERYFHSLFPVRVIFSRRLYLLFNASSVMTEEKMKSIFSLEDPVSFSGIAVANRAIDMDRSEMSGTDGIPMVYIAAAMDGEGLLPQMNEKPKKTSMSQNKPPKSQKAKGKYIIFAFIILAGIAMLFVDYWMDNYDTSDNSLSSWVISIFRYLRNMAF